MFPIALLRQSKNYKTMKQYIHITKEVRSKIKKTFKVSGVMLWKALSFESQSDLAQRIRKMALENYGIVMNELPAMETFHDHDNYMRQYLPNGVLLEFNKNDGTGDVFLRGVRVKRYHNVSITDIEAIQQWANTLR